MVEKPMTASTWCNGCGEYHYDPTVEQMRPEPLPLFPDRVRCGTCRWWDEEEARGRGRCWSVDESTGRPWLRVVLGGRAVETSEDFGCRLWEPREPTSASR